MLAASILRLTRPPQTRSGRTEFPGAAVSWRRMMCYRLGGGTDIGIFRPEPVPMPKSLLFIPGPVEVSEPVLAAMAKPLINHRGPEYARLLHSIAERMQSIFATKGDVLLLGSSGTGSLEAAVTNMFGPGDTLLACPTGVFGERIAAIAKMWGCTVEVLETPWGAGVDPQALAARLRADRENKITGILLTHNETSTGVQIDLGAMARAIGDHPAYVIVDSVSGLGASEFKMDEWKLDVVCAASQKALACPPGLAMVAVSSRAWQKMKSNKAPRFYFDLQKHKEFFDKGEPPWTPPVSVAFALDVAIDLYQREGPRDVWARHACYTDALHEAVKALGMQIFSRDGVHSVTVTGILTPQGLDNQTVLTKLLQEHGVVISGGQGKMAGKMWRWGTMGAISEADMVGALGAFETVIREMGYRFEEGAAVNAALDVFARTDEKKLIKAS
jgi:aspartate aminotransferase-like enzyme